MNIGASYSPDGQILAICSGTQYGNGVSLGGEMALYRIRADGTGKPVKIVGGKGQDWRYHVWRR